MISSLFNYWWHKIWNPELADFLYEGVGIEARYHRAAQYWRPHVALSRGFQRKAVESLTQEPRTYSILGAGRLLDVDQELLFRSGIRVHLYDADPSVAKSWKAFAQKSRLSGAQSEGHIVELTGRIAVWTTAIKEWLTSATLIDSNSLATFLDTLPGIPARPVEIQSADVLISLNLLSQIPIYWRERVLKLIRLKAPHLLSEEETIVGTAHEALERTATFLQRAHIEQVNSTSAKLKIVIADAEFYFYQREVAPWQVESAHSIDLSAELHGKIVLEDSWLWHLAPQGVEEANYGSIHKVCAVAVLT